MKKITFYDKDEAIQYQLKMKQTGYIAKMIQSRDKYEVIVAGEVPEWRQRTDWNRPGCQPERR